MNILTQCCGIILLLVMMYFYNNQKRVQLQTGRAFMGIWIATFLSLLLDFNSIILITYRDFLPDFLVKFGCKAYISSLVWEAIFYVIYVCSDIYQKGELYKKHKKRLYFSGFLFTVAVFSLPLYIHAEKANDTYTYGPAVILTYVLATSVLVLLTVLLHRYKNKINPNRRRAMRLWMLIWLLAALIQFLNNALLLVGFASAVGIMIIYLKLENPESNLDRETGLFNQTAFLLYMNQLLNQKNDYFLLGMSYSFGTGDSYSSNVDDDVYMEFIQYVSTVPGTVAFHCEEDTIAFVFSDSATMETTYRTMEKRFEKPWGKSGIQMITPRWFYMPNPRIVSEAKGYLYLFQYARQLEQDYVLIDENIAETLYREENVKRMLIDAIRDDRIEVFYQPIYSTNKNLFISAEALIRIRDEEGNIILPGDFIDVAERTGLIMKLGEIVFEKVCWLIQEKNPMQYGIEYIEINLSVIQCGYEHLASSYKKIMKKYKIPPHVINLEITETASLNEKRTLLANMHELRDYGVTFSLDDFGTGQSNLNYIVDMPVDIVKFDKDMIQSYFENDKAKYVMDAAMHMIHGLDLRIVSEGIETKEQYATMEQLGISYIQGYYFSKPLSQEKFITFIEENFTQ